MTLYLKAHSYTEISRERDPNEEYDDDDTYTSWSFGSSFSTKGDYEDVTDDYLCDFSLAEEKLIPNKEYCVHVAVWSTGNSFGCQDNYHASIVGIFEKDAVQPNEESVTSTQIYKPWEGYFESLSYVENVTATFMG